MRKWTERHPATADRLPHGAYPLLFLLGGLVLLMLLAVWAWGWFALERGRGEPKGEKAMLLVGGPVVDAETGLSVEASVYLDGQLLYENVRTVSVWVPSGAELRVEAEGYHPWGFRFRYHLREPQRMGGPIRLKPKR